MIAVYTFIVGWVVLLLALLSGWITNIMYLFNVPFEPITGEIVLSIIGVFLAPIGAFHGWYLWFT